MRTFPDLKMREVLREGQRAQKLLEEGDYPEARDLFLQLRARARKLGLRSGYLLWGLGVAYDNLGELELAFSTMSDAVNLDPFSPSAQRSFDIIAGRVRAALADASRAADDPSTPRLYQLLLGAGEADVPSHLAMARHLAACGDQPGAMRMLDAVTLLAPVSRDAWVQKGLLARAMGDLPLAVRCETEAATIAAADAPFGLPPEGAAEC